jgi:hypothetical protein
MKRESTNKPGTAKSDSAPEVTLESASIWAIPPLTPTAHRPGEEELSTAPPPPDWTRYIDSRLKQFCTR